MATKIIETEITKLKNVKDFHGKFDGKNVLLIADNERGKSSILRFLGVMFGDTSHLPPDYTAEGWAIIDRNGEKYKIEVEAPGKKSKVDIKVHTPTGGIITKKGSLADMFGSQDFDPDNFVNLSKTEPGRKEQVEEIMNHYPTEFVEEMNRQKNRVKSFEEQRTKIGRDRDNLNGRIKLHPFYNFIREESDLEKYPSVDTQKLLDELKTTNTHNENVNKGEIAYGQVKHDINELGKQMAELMKKIEDKKTDEKKIFNWLKENKLKPIEQLESDLKNAEKKNSDHKDAVQFLSDMKEFTSLETQYGEHTALIETARELIETMVKDQDPLVEGLTWDDNGLIWNGTPVHPETLSESQIMELGIRLRIAMNSEVPLLINRSESIGQARWETILGLADEVGLQVFAEQVKRGQDDLIVEFIPKIGT